ncbi:MAG TPA: DUF928 domain-containing protein [Nitrospiraceae bacterium]|jgi:hypothetical protein|nr:DUF928 domain-containing protein [Nitrospiraceae bacterium]
MNPRRPAIRWLAVCSLGFSGAAFDLVATPATEFQHACEADPPTTSRPLLYKPRERAMPRARVFGPARGIDSDAPKALALVPDHIGFTLSVQPTLYWYLSKPTSLPVTFTLIDTRVIKPLFHVTLAPPRRAGLQVIRLKEHGITLEEHVPYRWFVSLVSDPNSPARDIVTGGVIERVVEHEAACGMAVAASLEAARCYAEEGLWYDLFSVISDLIAASPDDRSLRRIRAAFLQQAGLPDVADWDLRQSGSE